MTVEANRHLIKVFVADCASIALAEDVVFRDHAQGRVFRGRPAVEALLRAFWVDGFPGVQTEVHRIVADESSATLECTLHGRQEGLFLGIPPTGRQVTLPMTIVFQLVEGQIRAANLYYDAGTLLRQLGLALDVGDWRLEIRDWRCMDGIRCVREQPTF